MFLGSPSKPIFTHFMYVVGTFVDGSPVITHLLIILDFLYTLIVAPNFFHNGIIKWLISLDLFVKLSLYNMIHLKHSPFKGLRFR